MPFTISHVAAVLPARRIRRLPLAGLAAGAMSPDLEYLFQLGTSRTVSHRPVGVLLLDVPLALLALALAGLAAPGLASLVPERWPEVAARLRAWRPPWASPAQRRWLVAAIVVGAVNHIVVDEFTHGGGAGVELVPWLGRYVAFAGRALPLYRWLQYGLSVCGLVVLAALAIHWFRTVQPRPTANTPLIEAHKAAIVLTLGGMTALAAVAQTIGALDDLGPNRATAVMLLIGAWRAGAFLLLGAGATARAVALLGPDGQS